MGETRTCQAGDEFGKLRPGTVIRYQTERMPCELTDTVAEVTAHSARLAGGRWISAADWFVVVDGAANERQDTRMEEPAKAGTTNGEERIIERRRELVAAVNALVETGVPVADACAKVSREGKHSITKTLYYSWTKQHGFAHAKIKSYSAKPLTHQRKRGPAMGKDHWVAYLTRVRDLVDGPEELATQTAVERVNGEMGCRHNQGTYYVAVRRYGIRSKLTKAELASRAMQARRAKEKAEGGGEIERVERVDSIESIDSGDLVEPKAAIAAEPEALSLPKGAEAAPDHLDVLAGDLRQLVAVIGGELVGRAEALRAGMVAKTEELVADLARARGMLGQPAKAGTTNGGAK